MDQGDPRRTSDHFHCKVIRVYLNFGLDSALNVTESRGHLTENRHDYVLELFPLHVVRQVLFIDDVLNVHMVLTIGTEHFPLLLNHLFQLDQGFGVSHYSMFIRLFVEHVVVKLSEAVVHVLAPCVFKVLIVQQNTLAPTELHHIN